MTAERFIPVTDADGDAVWLSDTGDVTWVRPSVQRPAGWHRLGYLEPVDVDQVDGTMPAGGGS